MTALLTENIGPLSLAPDGVQRLRALVLDLAVRGLLTQPHEGDDRADDLLAQILRDREGLVAAGDLKFKALPALKREDVPYQLPAHWLWTRLGEITNYGATTKADTIPDDAWLLDLEDVEKDTSRLLRRVRFIERGSLSDKNAFRTGDVLYCKLRPYLNKVIVADQDGYCTTEILPVRCHGRWVPAYFKLALKSPQFLAYVNRKSYGMKMPRLGTEDGRMAVFPLPPLAEQHRIVAKVDELMALCDRLEARQQNADVAHARLVQALLDSLTQTHDADEFQACWQRLAGNFHLFRTLEDVERLKQTTVQLAVKGMLVKSHRNDCAVDDLIAASRRERDAAAAATGARKAKTIAPLSESEYPFVIPESWRWARLGDIAAVVDPNPSHRMPRYVSEGVPFVSTENFSAGDSIDFSIGKKVTAETLAEQESKFQIRSGAFALSRIGTIGKTRPLPVERTYCLSHALCVVSPYLQQINSRFLRLAVTADNILEHAHAGVQSIGVPDLGVGTIRSMPIPIPPPEIQAEIVARVDAILSLCDQLKARIAAARAKHAQLAVALVEAAVA